MKKLNWGILGLGQIATEFAETFDVENAVLYAAGSRNAEKAAAFAEKAKKYELLLVPSDSFGMGGYVRISYCVSTKQIENSLPAFKALIEEYK